jgi:peptidoglycan/LPS O-acetylase OafA/YrhL
MRYLFPEHSLSKADLASGKVLFSRPGLTAFPVRLGNELFLRGAATRNYGFSDAADLFVFISGNMAAFVFGRVMIEQGYFAAASRLVKRALQLYAAHILVVVIYIAVIAAVAQGTHDASDLHAFNVAAFITKRFGNSFGRWPCDTGPSIWTCFRSISCYWERLLRRCG